jgi:hypothetical protein
VALSTKVGTFSCNTSTGTQAITGVGFSPKVIIFWGCNNTSAGTAASVRTFIGLATAEIAQTHSQSIYAEDAAATTVTYTRAAVTTACIRFAKDGNVSGVAALQSMDVGGFTLDWTTAAEAAYMVIYLAIGGDDLTNYKVDTFDYGNSTGDQSFTGMGFQPTFLLTASTLTSSGATAVQDIGVTTGTSNQYALSYGSRDNQAACIAGMRLRELCYSRISNILSDATLATLKSFDADGFTFNFSSSGSTQNCKFLALAGPQILVGAATSPTSTGVQTITTSGIVPKAVLLFSAGEAATTSLINGLAASYGISDGTNQTALWLGDKQSADPTETKTILSTSKFLQMYAAGSSPSLIAECSLDSFNSGNFKLNWATADATARQFVYVVLGEAAASSTPLSAETSSSGFDWNQLIENLVGAPAEVANDLNEWDDTSSLQLFVNLESTGASSLSAWLDALAIFTPVGIEKFPEDTLVLSDSSLVQLAVQLTEALGDDFELTEALEIIQGYHTISGSDLANWLDAVSNIDPVLRSVADSINNWDEFLALARNWSLSFSDRMTLDDRIKLAYLLTRIVASQIALSDSTLLNKGKLVPFTDTLEISDAATLNFGDWNPYGVADALAQTDGVSLHLSTAEDDYYRRQINDRNMIHGEQMKFFSDQMVMSDGASAWMT